MVKSDDHLGTKVCPFKQFVLHKMQVKHFICKYCKNLSHCVLNGFHIVEIPAELSGLDYLGRQFIQRAAKAFQTMVQLIHSQSFHIQLTKGLE